MNEMFVVSQVDDFERLQGWMAGSADWCFWCGGWFRGLQDEVQAVVVLLSHPHSAQALHPLPSTYQTITKRQSLTSTPSAPSASA